MNSVATDKRPKQTITVTNWLNLWTKLAPLYDHLDKNAGFNIELQKRSKLRQ